MLSFWIYDYDHLSYKVLLKNILQMFCCQKMPKFKNKWNSGKYLYYLCTTDKEQNSRGKKISNEKQSKILTGSSVQRKKRFKWLKIIQGDTQPQ